MDIVAAFIMGSVIGAMLLMFANAQDFTTNQAPGYNPNLQTQEVPASDVINNEAIYYEQMRKIYGKPYVNGSDD